MKINSRMLKNAKKAYDKYKAEGITNLDAVVRIYKDEIIPEKKAADYFVFFTMCFLEGMNDDKENLFQG